MISSLEGTTKASLGDIDGAPEKSVKYNAVPRYRSVKASSEMSVVFRIAAQLITS